MNWWQVILIISACTCWSLLSALVGAAITNTVHAAHAGVEQAKWQVPDAIQGHN